MNHIVKLYKNHSSAEELEKVMINLNLYCCSKPVIDELIVYCKEHYLSTAILYLNSASTHDN
jgi:hypothetical protein